MAPHSFIGLAALAALSHFTSAVPQAPLEQVPQPEVSLSDAVPANAAPSGGADACGQCQLVADVAGLVWYSQVFINTAATQLVGVGVNNGSRATRTSLVQDEGDFTFNPGATAAGDGALTQVNFEPSVTVAGAVLTSPTAYNVFTGYTITSAYEVDGSCTTTTEVKTLTSAYSEILPSANGRVFLDPSGQKAFIDFLGFTTCSGGGENVSPTALLQVTNTTATSTMTFSGLLQSASLSIPATTPASVSASPTKSMVFPSVKVPEIVVGNKTITPSSNPIGLPVVNGTTLSSGAFPGPTGTITPFVGGGSNTRLPSPWLLAWAVGFAGFGVGAFYL